VLDVRLSAKVSREALEEIALTLDREEASNGLEFAFYFLEGVETGKGSPWAFTRNLPGHRTTRILGLTIEEERSLRSKPLALPVGSQGLGTWLSDNRLEDSGMMGLLIAHNDAEYDRSLQRIVDSRRVTIYRNAAGSWRVLYDAEQPPTPLVLEQSESEEGVNFSEKGGLLRFVIDRGGVLRVYSNDGEFISTPKAIKPPLDTTRVIRERDAQGFITFERDDERRGDASPH
jgi:hypothetical protein